MLSVTGKCVSNQMCFHEENKQGQCPEEYIQALPRHFVASCLTMVKRLRVDYFFSLLQIYSSIIYFFYLGAISHAVIQTQLILIMIPLNSGTEIKLYFLIIFIKIFQSLVCPFF